MKAIILAAGVGSRIGNKLPKCLIKLPTGVTLLENQLDILRKAGIREVLVVVGFKKEVIMERFPDAAYRYNPLYHVTNTSQSLMMALDTIEPDDVIWLNGDVFLEPDVVKRVLEKDGNVVAVNKAKCGAEEVKYRTDGNERIVELSKSVVNGEGEAIGVNKITKAGFQSFLAHLKQCDRMDYFEKGIELAIQNSLEFYPVDISDCKCIEIDFKEDLERVYEIC